VGAESKLGPLDTSATEWPIVPAPGDYDDGEFGGKLLFALIFMRRLQFRCQSIHKILCAAAQMALPTVHICSIRIRTQMAK
jgi:hypothetical protein